VGENSIKSPAPTFTFPSLPSITILIYFNIGLSATMGRKPLTLEDRLALSSQRGFIAQTSSDLYDSHKHWTVKMMTTDNVFYFLKIRLADEYNPGDWTASAKQCS
jgi:hypothetical protein